MEKMKKTDKIKLTEEYVRQGLRDYDSGHDWWHIERVRRMALLINRKESGIDPFNVEIAALLHDSADSKFITGDIYKRYEDVMIFMEKNGMNRITEQVINVIRNISFSNKMPADTLSNPLLHVISDADKLDALGAIGIARAFNYGGFRNNLIFNPDNRQQISTTIGHFYHKLLKLKDMMYTETGRCLAVERHKFLEVFLEQFYSEWNMDIKI